MFNRDSSDPRRVQIIDISHLFFKFAYGGAPALSAVIKVDGELKRVDTTLPKYTINQIHRWSNMGYNPTVVCFDGAGCSRSRKAYFAKNAGVVANDYKGAREVRDQRFYDGMNITMNLLMQGGVCCLKADGYEADDLIKAAVDKCKEQYPNLPIDVITGDADLVPLVDDQVSVFLSSKKMTWAEDKDIEKRHYVQITPVNYQMYIEDLSSYRNLSVPYNTLLLTKLLRGDKSDNIKGYEKFTPTKYNNLIESLLRDGHDLSTLCRYDEPVATICYRGTEEPIPADIIDSVPREQKMIKFSEPRCLTNLCEVLSNYLDDSIVEHVRHVYNGINLNGAFTGLPEGFNRRPATITAPINGYVASKLQEAVQVVQINLPVV